MAIAFLSEEKYKRAKVMAGDLVENYKKIGGAFVEGDNETIEGTHKWTALFDEKLGKAEKPKKLGKTKKRK